MARAYHNLSGLERDLRAAYAAAEGTDGASLWSAFCDLVRDAYDATLPDDQDEPGLGDDTREDPGNADDARGPMPSRQLDLVGDQQPRVQPTSVGAGLRGERSSPQGEALRDARPLAGDEPGLTDEQFAAEQRRRGLKPGNRMLKPGSGCST